MTIAIDGVFMTTSQPGGYRTYASNLVQALAALESKHTFRILVDRPVDLHLPTSWRTENLPRQSSLGFIWREQMMIPRYVADAGVELLHVPGASGPLRRSVPMVATLYDTIEFSDPLPSPMETKRWAMRLYSRFAQARVARLADHVVTISEYSKTQIMRRFGVDETKITVTHLAPATHFTQVESGNHYCAISNLGLGPGYVLGIASATPRKNTVSLLAAYAKLPSSIRERHRLMLVCTHAGLKEKIQATANKLELGEQVCLLHDVSDAQLAALYHQAGVFVFPSYEEGFGLPPLEAMASGTAVIASITSSLPEILGEAAILISPSDIDGIAAAMEAVLTDHALADSLRHKGLLCSKQYSWEKTARQTLTVYESVIGGA